MSNYRVLQLTNANVGAVPIGAFLPLGTVTRKISHGNCLCPTFTVTTSGANTITLNEAGYYHITYTASLIGGAAGTLTAALQANGVTVLTASETVTAAGDTENITIDYVIRVFPNTYTQPTNNPLTLQILLGGVAITGGVSNIVVEKTY